MFALLSDVANHRHVDFLNANQKHLRYTSLTAQNRLFLFSAKFCMLANPLLVITEMCEIMMNCQLFWNY